MPVAYSKHRIVNDVLRADTAAHFIADLELQLIAAGWVHDRTLTGGYVYVMTSPDQAGYQAKLLVQDDINYKIDNPLVDLYNIRGPVLRVLNMDESIQSFQYQMQANNAFDSFQTVVGKSQLFISVPGVDGQHWASFACGIPAMPVLAGSCVLGLTPPTITDMWWACGGSQWGFDFRTQANCYANMNFYLNGSLHTAPDNNSISPDLGYLCLFPLTSPDTYSSGTVNWPTITYSAHAVLNIDAFLGWAWNVRGLLWDAFLQTAAQTLDATGVFFDQDDTGAIFQVHCLTWHSEFYSSLQLITDVTGAGAGNSAY